MFDINEPPTDINLSNYTVAENANVGTVIGNLSIEEPDRGQTHVCILLDDPLNTFEILGNLFKVKQNVFLNFERANIMSVLVQCVDSGIPKQSFKKQLSVVIADLNERPFSMSISNARVAENSANRSIGTFRTMDPDGDVQFNYKLLRGTEYFALRSNELLTKIKLNYEKKNSHEIEVRSTDSGGIISKFPNTLCICKLLGVKSYKQSTYNLLLQYLQSTYYKFFQGK